jgi:hypothetical protein
MQPRPRFLLLLADLGDPEAPVHVRLRRLLKSALRAHRLRCLDGRELSDDRARGPESLAGLVDLVVAEPPVPVADLLADVRDLADDLVNVLAGARVEMPAGQAQHLVRLLGACTGSLTEAGELLAQAGPPLSSPAGGLNVARGDRAA